MPKKETPESHTVRYDPKYAIVDLETGETQPIPVYDNSKGERWDKAWAKTLAELLELSGESRTKIIAYMLRNKDYKNVVIATVRKIADELEISTKTVHRTLLQMEKANFINRLQSGVIMFSPHICQPGQKYAGIAVMRRWSKAQRGEE